MTRSTAYDAAAPTGTTARRLIGDAVTHAIQVEKRGKHLDETLALPPSKRLAHLHQRILHGKNPPDSLIGIGHFVSLEVRTTSGIAKSIRPAHGQALWLAWKGDPDGGDLIIVEPGHRAKPGNEETATHHRTFHGADPVAWQTVAWHPPRQPLERLGFATAITYRIPGKMPSNKVSETDTPTDWRHSFGDFGALDNQSTDKGLHPAVARGADGTVYLMRRPRNKYRLADWLYG